MRAAREILLWAGGLLIGAALGAVLSASTTQPWFPQAIGGLGIAGLVLTGLYGATAFSEWRLHRSAPLEFAFEGEGTPCVEQQYGIVDTKQEPNPDGGVNVSGRVVVKGVTMRLHVRNRRKHRLSEVRARVTRITLPDGTVHERGNPLRWINDPEPAFPASHAGITIGSGHEPQAYVSVAHKQFVDPRDFSVLFANQTLASQGYSSEAIDLDIEVDARDETTGTPAPSIAGHVRIATEGDALRMTVTTND